MKNNQNNKLFDIFNYTFMILFTISILLPFIHLLSISLSPPEYAVKYGLHIIPEKITFYNYQKVLESVYIWIGYKNTIFRTLVGTALSLLFTSLGGYVLSKKYYPHRNFWTFIIVFTMFFSGGLIPTYLLVRSLGLIDSRLSMILPGLISPFNLVIMRNYFMSLPEEIEESCIIEGANSFTILFLIIYPISKPLLATIALWLAVGHWNAWFDVLIYIRDTSKFVLQIVLRRIILEGTQQMLDLNPGELEESKENTNPVVLKAAAVFVTTVPILCVYPFIQKYFVRGIMLGSLKG